MTASARTAAALVVKLGGDVLEGDVVALVADDLRNIVCGGGGRVVVVHGGGAQATRLSQRLGMTPRIVGGRRITDAETLDVMKMTVAGQVNVDLVTALRAAGVPAVGLAGTSGIVRAHRRPPRIVVGGGAAPIDFGLVGDIDGFDLPLLSLLMDAARTPVLACLGWNEQGGGALNINADVVAGQLAAALRAHALVAVTAIGGVLRDKADASTRLSRLTVAQARDAIQAGVVQGGMIPKLEEAFAPLEAGVPAVHIVAPGQVAAALAHPGSVGTVLVAA